MRRIVLLAFLLCGCDGLGPVVEPLPPGGLPAAQTLEGGAQIRVTQTGFQKLTSIVPGLLDQAASTGVCLPRMDVGDVEACFTNQGSCIQGCDVALHLDFVDVTVTSANRISLALQMDASASVRIDDPFISPCTLDLSIANFLAGADLSVGVDAATGELRVAVDRINSFDASGVDTSGCGALLQIAPVTADLVNSFVGTFVIDWLTPALEDLIAAKLPAQLEMAGRIDLPGLALVGPDASNGSTVETRIVPGGYANLGGNSLSLGVITGFNSDEDPETRAPGLASEPAACVAGLVAPDLGAPPTSLALTSRGTFLLPPAGSFVGNPEPAADVQLGLSQTALDLAGHHVVASGGLCLDVEAERVGFVRRDALDDLLGVPLAATASDLRLRVRPQGGVRFAVGTGLAEDPHLTAFLDALEIEVDAVAGETATPALTLAADLEIGFQYGTRSDAGVTSLEPTRVLLRVLDPAVSALDARYAPLDPAALDALAATAADVVFSALGADAGVVTLPNVAGLELANVAVSRVDTSSDAFLAVTASLGAVAEPGGPAPGDPAPTPVPTAVSVEVPEAAALRSALVAGSDAELPTVHVELPNTDGPRALEHTWRTRGGPWRPYQATGDLVIRDRSFAWQGEHEIELRSRAVGTDDTISPIAALSALVDYAAPTLLIGPSDLEGPLDVPARDAVSDALEWALGRVGESEPETEWSATSSFDRTTALALGDSVVVYVRDEAGHVAQALVQLVPEPGGAAAVALACLALLARRARR